MLEMLKRLIWDENYLSQKVRAAIGFVGMLVIGGVIEVPAIPDDTVWGYWATKIIGAALAACAWWVRSGDKTTPAAAALEHAPQEEMEAGLVRFGVPPAVAVKAAESSEERELPPV
jgi:hypothetical protein